MLEKAKTYTNLTIEELPGSEIELTGEIPVEYIGSFRSKAVKKLKERLELPGFRKGHVPDEMVVKHVGEQELMKEIAEQALGEVYADIVEDKKLEVVGRPAVTITKLAPNNPIGFKIRSAVFPKVDLPDYKKLATAELKKHDDPEKVTVEDAEVEKELENIQKAMSAAGEKEEAGEKKETKVEPIDDAFAKKLGNFKDLDDLKKKMKDQILFEKKGKSYEKRRLAVADAILAKCTFSVPQIFVEGELEQMIASFNDRVSKAGIQMDEYLKQIGKTIDDLKKEWQGDAEKRSKLQIVLNEIAQKEAIIPDVARLDREVKHVLEHYPDAEERAVRTYVRAQMTNEKVFEFLEGGKNKQEASSEGAGHVHDHTCDHDHEHEHTTKKKIK